MAELKNVTIQVDENQLWRVTFGSGFDETFSWWASHVTFKEGSWEEPGVAIVKVDDPEDENAVRVITKEVRPDDLVQAWGKVLNKEGGYWHCNTRINDFDDFDSCAGDVLMQLVMLDEVVYG